MNNAWFSSWSPTAILIAQPRPNRKWAGEKTAAEVAQGNKGARGGHYVNGKAKETDDEYPHDRQGRGDVPGRHGTDGLPAGEGPQATGLQGGRAVAPQSRHDRGVEAEGRRPRAPGRVRIRADSG